MGIYCLEVDNIYSSRTKEYFREVISSYNNGNYRSAVVVLYSVCICDLFYKLQELRDVYSDGGAGKILSEIENERKNSRIKSDWEWNLVDRIFKESKLLDAQSYTNLLHLKDDRNLAAHPTMKGSYELMAPSREVTVAHITNAVKDILSKPSIFIKSVFDMMTNDLDAKKSYLMQDKSKLRSFLENIYFSRMPLPMKKKIFEKLWRFSFCKIDDQKCLDNMEVNREALIILSEQLTESIPDLIRGFNKQCVLAEDNRVKKSFIIYLSHFSNIYGLMPDDTKDSLNSYISNFPGIKYICWFLKSDVSSHLNSLLGSNDTIPTMPDEHVRYFETYILGKVEKKELLDFYVSYYGKSPHYDDADKRFGQVIYPHLSDFDAEQIKLLIEKSDYNPQLYGRKRSRFANNAIFNIARKKLPANFDYKQYPYFVYDEN